MIESLEGRAGHPRPRPPFPAQKGLWANADEHQQRRDLVQRSRDHRPRRRWFADIGTPNSPGTKVFSLVGKIRNTGLVELPLGTPLKNVIYDIGQGAPDGKPVKGGAVGRPVRRLHPGDEVRRGDRLRIAGADRRDHGLRRHGGDG